MDRALLFAAAMMVASSTFAQDVDRTVLDCDRHAASNNDVNTTAGRAGVKFKDLTTEKAKPACEAAYSANPDVARLAFQLGRVEVKLKNYERARTLLEEAIAKGYTLAAVELERVHQLIAGMNREQVALADPDVRAERFIQNWQELQSEREELQGWQHNEARAKIEDQMRGMAKGLERDPQVETALRHRAPELGISHLGKNHNIAREMERQISQGHSQNRGIER